MGVLVVYYSRSGHTAKIARSIARRLDADVEELFEEPPRAAGIAGYLRAGLDAARGRTGRLRPMVNDPAKYDLVIVGTPVWASSVTPAVRSFLEANASRVRRIAFFLTHGGSGRARVLAQMESAAGRAPVATAAVRESELAAPEAEYIVEGFVSFLRGVTTPRAAAA
jgi:flavodoxin